MGNKGLILVLEQLLALRFNLQIGTMYVEQELYAPSGVVSKIILMPKTRSGDGSSWTLEAGSFKVIIGFWDFQMQVSTMILTNELGTSTINFPSIATVKIVLSDDHVFVLSNDDNEIVW